MFKLIGFGLGVIIIAQIIVVTLFSLFAGLMLAPALTFKYIVAAVVIIFLYNKVRSN